MIEGTIESIAFGGSGVLKNAGLVVFVPFTAPQDEVTVALVKEKKHCAFGSLRVIHTPGPNRILPRCSHFTLCGGCQLQHMDYPAQLESKRRFIKDALQRIAGMDIDVPPIAAAPHPWAYRSHVTLRLEPHLGGFRAGYTAIDNQSLVTVAECPIFCSPEEALFSHLQALVFRFSNRGVKKATVRLLKIDKKYRLAFNFFPQAPENIAICEELLTLYPEIESIFVSAPEQKLSFGPEECVTTCLEMTFAYSPYGFLQNFPEQRDAIYQTILSQVPAEAHKILDLYCGIGITSLLFAKEGKRVMAIESNAHCIRIAQQNAERNHITGAVFYQNKVEEKTPELLEAFKPDSILCNPPRSGLDPAFIRTIAAHRVAHIQYLSCMPSTLARDLKVFIAEGYVVEKVLGFDMFPQTTHVETLVLLRLTHSGRNP